MNIFRSTYALFIIALAPFSLQANVLFNGSFETNAGGGCVPSGFVTIGVGSTCITGWSVVSGNVDYVSSGLWDAENGTFSFDMSGTTNGAIAQTFATDAGFEYDVTFWLAGNYAAAPTIKTLEVSADGQSQDYTFDITGKSAHNMGYVQETFSFVANGASATLQFTSADNPGTDAGPVLDNVTAIEVTPEPGSFSLVLLALLGTAITARLRRA
jgi:choice-of-anchor C domain-containing protein